MKNEHESPPPGPSRCLPKNTKRPTDRPTFGPSVCILVLLSSCWYVSGNVMPLTKSVKKIMEIPYADCTPIPTSKSCSPVIANSVALVRGPMGFRLKPSPNRPPPPPPAASSTTAAAADPSTAPLAASAMPSNGVRSSDEKEGGNVTHVEGVTLKLLFSTNVHRPVNYSIIVHLCLSEHRSFSGDASGIRANAKTAARFMNCMKRVGACMCVYVVHATASI